MGYHVKVHLISYIKNHTTFIDIDTIVDEYEDAERIIKALRHDLNAEIERLQIEKEY